MGKRFKTYPVHLPFNCPFCGAPLNIGAEPDLMFCPHVQFIRMKGETFEYFIYVNGNFGRHYLDGLKASAPYKKYLSATNSPGMDEQIEQDFITGEYKSITEITAAVPYFEGVALDAAPTDSALFIEKRPYGHVLCCLGSDPVNTPEMS
ncbi:MAG: hypothetical protein JXA41_04435 [Deltaproteobacteria bacterium]|nr:hypothetical protein [Deltaproteobacteria bacterium]